MSSNEVPLCKRSHTFNFQYSYSCAINTCKLGCLKEHGGKIKISNDVWERNQNKLLIDREHSKPSTRELDAYYRNILKTKLDGYSFEDTKKHTRLLFEVSFDTNPVSLCDSCFVCFNCHKSLRSFREWKQNYKVMKMVRGGTAAMIEDINAQSKKHNPVSAGKFNNIKAARKELSKISPPFTELQMRLACVPDSPAARDAFWWLEKFFALVGDYAPNRFDKVQLPGIYSQESIHLMYKYHLETLSGNESQPLELRAFEQLWHNIWPNVTISKFCQVSGKCYTCHALYERQEVFKSANELKDIQTLAGIHKIMIEMQRGAYINNRQLAQEHPDLYMSLIMDGMSQDHCALPHYANQHQEKGAVLKQKITGAKQHGISRSFYRTYPHIDSGANLACEVLLHEIEHRMDKCIKENTKFPRYLMLQIDGGPENTSKTFYGLCEALVQQGVFDRIDVSRLPVGHTHEDIDALFGVLWRAAQGKTLITPKDWKNMALSAFSHIEIDEDDDED